MILLLGMALRIIDSSNIITVNKVIHRRSIWSRGTGLMFHKEIFDEAHVFYFNKPFKIALTMFFVFFPIDVLFIKNNKIVEMKENFMPFTNYTSKKEADIFIELPSGFIKKNKIYINQKISID